MNPELLSRSIACGECPNTNAAVIDQHLNSYYIKLEKELPPQVDTALSEDMLYSCQAPTYEFS